MRELNWLAESLAETCRLANCLATAIQHYLEAHSTLVLGFNGMMGAGKTTFSSALCTELGVEPDAVSSPTFSLQNCYFPRTGIPAIHHFDFHRIRDEDELLETGFEEVVTQPGLHLVEWAGLYPDCLPADTLFVEIEHRAPQSRQYRLHGPQASLLLEVRDCLGSGPVS